MQLLIDDGVTNRGHRENIFNSAFRVLGCYSGDHKDFQHMTVLDYVGMFVPTGGADPIMVQMDEFLKEPVDFDMPDDVKSWKQNSKI